MKKNNIILIGFMGTGKSSVGISLASALSMKFLDTDNEIEKCCQMTISELFQSKGEEAFRFMETNLLLKYQETLNQTVISTGGGMPLRAENASLLREIGYVIFLKTSKEVTYQRLKHDTTRPLLQCEDPLGAIEQMLKIRVPIYEALADMVLETEDKSVDRIVQEILLMQKNINAREY
ncbi:shikimate kinase [Lachnoclostridium phytofermentans]|uniref:shikimate kinase n=1 Tax=Lachnoclostridium phytofermentans TaxID=66219 RepID=UPI000558CD5E|nr:shikimate kinase [Lachnoclostridium phytofermentans]